MTAGAGDGGGGGGGGGVDEARKLQLEQSWTKLVGGGVYCISLQERPDRFSRACQEAHKWGLCRLIRFLRTTKPSDALLASAGVEPHNRGFFGSWEAHRACAVDACRRGFDCQERVLILEDDFELLSNTTSADRVLTLARDAGRLSKRADWDVLFLGHMPFCGVPALGDLGLRLFKTKSVWIHAYILSPSGQRMLACQPFPTLNASTLDGWLSRNSRQYAVFPMMAVQASDDSDNLTSQASWDAKVILWWIRVHRKHAMAIEIAVYAAVAAALALICILVMSASMSLFRRLLRLPPHLPQSFAAIHV
jgi:hypothetical protein